MLTTRQIVLDSAVDAAVTSKSEKEGGQGMRKKNHLKRAVTLVELLICLVLFSLLVVFAVSILDIACSAATETINEYGKLNAYDIFLDTYTDAVKNAYDVTVSDGENGKSTRLTLITPSGTHSFEFIYNRLYIDEEEALKAKNGSFSYGDGYVTVMMQPEGYGDIKVSVAPDISPDSTPQFPPLQEVFLIGIRIVTPPDKLEYIHGEMIDTTGLTIELRYNDGSSEIIDTGYDYSPVEANYSNPLLTVTYVKSGRTMTASIPLTVHRLLTDLVLIREQDQKDCSVGEPFNPDGLILKATYNDGNSDIITSGYVCGNITSYPPGSATNTISFTHRGDTLSVVVPVNIYEVIPIVPTQRGALIYNGKAQSPEWNDYSSRTLEIGGTSIGTNAGKYIATFTPADYCWWSDRTRTERTVEWEISKAGQTISVPSETVHVHIWKTTTIDPTVTAVTGGTPVGDISFSSDNISVATVDESTGLVTAVSPGTCTITIYVPGTDNYIQAVKTIAVIVDDHSYSTTYTVDVEPTCTAEGSKSYHCTEPDCPATTGTVSIPMTPHTYGDWVIDTDATCTSAGSRHRVCTACGVREDGSIARLGHSWTSYLESSATCTSPAYYYDRCSRCGTYSSSYSYGSALGHDYRVSSSTAATCTAGGKTTYKCSRCGASYSNTTAALGHNMVSHTTNPTCTSSGSTYKQCTRCNAKGPTTTLDALGHNYGSYGSWSYYNSTQHVRTRTCSRCGATSKSYSAHYSTDSSRLCRGCGSYF